MDQIFGAVSKSDTGESVTVDTAMTIPTLFRCVGLLSTVIAGCTLRVFRNPGKTEIFPALLDKGNPNLQYTYYELMELVVTHIALWGNAYVLKVRASQLPKDDPRYSPKNSPGEDVIMDLRPINPTLVEPRLQDGHKIFLVKRISKDGKIDNQHKPEVFTTWDIMHIPGMGYDGMMGFSVIENARRTLGTSIAADRLAAKFYLNGSMLGGIIQVKAPLANQTQADEIRRRWLVKHSGVANSGDVAVLDAETTYQPITIPPDQLQFLESRAWQTREVARMFGIPPHLVGDVEKSTSWGCLPGDTQVFTDNGPVPLGNIKVGDQVWSYNDDNGIELKPVIAWWMSGYKPLMTFETHSRTVRATSNHHMIVRRYRTQAEVGKGNTRWETLRIDASEVRVGDCFILPRCLPDQGGTTAPNGRRLTPEVMELLGLYTGDGCYTDKKHRGNAVSIAHGTAECDNAHMPYYREVVKLEFGKDLREQKGGTDSRFSSAEFVSLLGPELSVLAHEKRVPRWVFKLTEELRLAYLRGYFDADGTINKSGGVSYISVNPDLLHDVRHLAISVGLPVGRVRNRHDGGPMKACTSQAFANKDGEPYIARDRYVLSLQTVTENWRIGSHCPHKAVRFKSPLAHTRLQKYDAGYKYGISAADKNAHPNRDPMRGLPKDVVIERVRSISEGSLVIPVFDLTIDVNHSLIADGTFLAQSGIEQQNVGFVAYTISGWTNRIEQRFTREVINVRKQYAEFDLDRLMRGAMQERFTAYAVGIQWGWLTRNEARIKENMPPIDGLDVPLTPLNMATGNPDSPLGLTPIGGPQKAGPKPKSDSNSDPD